MTQPAPDLNVLRRANAITLFQEFAEQRIAQGAGPKGLEQEFAAHVQTSASMWSQIKSGRPIGNKLARQLETLCGRPAGWLDEEHESRGLTAAESKFIAIALAAWRASGSDARKQLQQMLSEVAKSGRSPAGKG